MKLWVSTVAIAFALAGSAQAATFDFGAAGAAKEGSVEGEMMSSGGVTLTFDAVGDDFAYLDGIDDGRLAGLGVCGAITDTKQCSDSGDDNVTSGEAVTLMFDQVVTITDLKFRGERHFEVDAGGEIDMLETLLINGGSYTFGEAQSEVFEDISSITFAYGGAAAEQFYLNIFTATPAEVVVPLPATLPLLLAGAGALGWVARRRKA